MHHRAPRDIVALAVVGLLFGCGPESTGIDAEDGIPISAGPSIKPGPSATISTNAPTSDAGVATPIAPPTNIVPTELGGYALGVPLTGDGIATGGAGATGSGQSCNYLVGVVRDFKGTSESNGHPDFETYSGSAPSLGLVAPALGSDRKPVYTGRCDPASGAGSAACPFGLMTTNQASFDQWYRFANGVDKPYVVYLQFVPNGSLFTFQSNTYFPLDGKGWGNSGIGTDQKNHNFDFTTELHTEFRYNGGERFTFIGDDDVWVFMNGKLAIDLGGLHPPATGTIDLDAEAVTLGLTKGGTYALELFQAERHTSGSTFRVDTNLAFTNCGSIPPDVPK